MKISELFRRLSYGELSNLAISGEGSGEIVEAAWPKVINHANEALLRLHSRFVLREGGLVLELAAGVTDYRLTGRHALTQAEDPEGQVPGYDVPLAYIVDSEENPFLDDVVKVLGVTGIDGNRFALNDAEDPASLFTPQPNVLRVPRPLPDLVLSIKYQARHPELPLDANVDAEAGDEDEAPEIDLPFALEGALQAYVAYKVFDHMNGQEHQAKAQAHLLNYEGICAEVTSGDLVSQSTATTNTKFELRGFV